jgi:hypothetical protein
MIVIAGESTQSHSLRIVILPKNPRQSLVAGNQLQISDRRLDYLVRVFCLHFVHPDKFDVWDMQKSCR